MVDLLVYVVVVIVNAKRHRAYLAIHQIIFGKCKRFVGGQPMGLFEEEVEQHMKILSKVLVGLTTER
ncbi:hypothetical protein A2U01_0021116 [Trifolium medium]|uniref:Uncharacterized protein n=1 Tax=Trifolium medium TaxID=97028 RepID=A0A392NLJ8_9FABA|nr:hypothetical protein [Trifolium medium]